METFDDGLGTGMVLLLALFWISVGGLVYQQVRGVKETQDINEYITQAYPTNDFIVKDTAEEVGGNKSYFIEEDGEILYITVNKDGGVMTITEKEVTEEDTSYIKRYEESMTPKQRGRTRFIPLILP